MSRLRSWPGRSKRLLLASGVCTAFWLVYASVWALGTGGGLLGWVKSMGLVFFGWPQLYRSFFLPWSRSLPFIGLLLVAALAYQAVVKARSPLHELLRHPACVVVWVGLCFSVLRPTYPEVRYVFFIYPVILTVIAMSVLDIVRRLQDRPEGASDSRAALLGSTVFLLTFAVSSDFNVSHILNVNHETVVYRSSEYERFARLWYSRDDFESPGEYVERRLKGSKGAKVVVVNQPPVSYYLRRPHGVYYDRGNRRFTNVAREEGRIDLWSGQLLLGTPDDLRVYTRDVDTVWLVRTTVPEDRQFEIGQVWDGRLVAARREFVNADGTVEVVRVTLTRPAPLFERHAEVVARQAIARPAPPSTQDAEPPIRSER